MGNKKSKNYNDPNNPINLKLYKTLINDYYLPPSNYFYFPNSFIIFNSIDDIFYLIYSNKNNLLTFDLNDNKKIVNIKNAHKGNITNFRYYLDQINKRDLIISISFEDKNIKLWNVKNFECLHIFEKVNDFCSIVSACFFNDSDNIYIITSCYLGLRSYQPPNLIRIFDLDGNKIKEINDSNFFINYIDSYYDDKISKNFIIVATFEKAISYDFKENKKYKNYLCTEEFSMLLIL